MRRKQYTDMQYDEKLKRWYLIRLSEQQKINKQEEPNWRALWGIICVLFIGIYAGMIIGWFNGPIQYKENCTIVYSTKHKR